MWELISKMSLEFEDVSSSRKSQVWQHFLFNRSREEGKCKTCSTVLKMSGSSTKTLMNHLKLKHKILVKSCNEAETPSKSKTARIDSFFKKEKESLSEVIAQLVAKDGFSFSQIAKSELTRRAFKSDGFDIPISRQGVRNQFMREYKLTSESIANDILAAKEKGARFSISFDESTSVRNRRYMNINLHNATNFQSLGLIRINGSMNTEKAIQFVRDRLEKFHLNLDNDIVATITDGASVMMKFGKTTTPIHIACLAHAIHLCICDIVYKKNTIMGGLKNSCDEKDDDQNEDDDSDKDSDDFENRDFDQEVPKLVPELGKVVSKVRKIVKLFRKSPVRNDDNLQPQIKLSFGKEKALFLDCKTRWNSLLQMPKRLYELRKEVRIAMVQLDQHFDISDEELVRIKELCDALAPIEMAVEYLCREDADLLLAEKVTEFTTKNYKILKHQLAWNWLKCSKHVSEKGEILSLFIF